MGALGNIGLWLRRDLGAKYPGSKFRFWHVVASGQVVLLLGFSVSLSTTQENGACLIQLYEDEMSN